MAPGSLGYYVDRDQTRGRTLGFKYKPDILMRRGSAKALNLREAGFLYAIVCLPRRVSLVSNDELLASICSMQPNDVVQLRHNRTVLVGIVVSIWEAMNKADPNDLLKLRIEVELLDCERTHRKKGKSRMKIDAGQILVVSSSVVTPPRHNSFEGSMKMKEMNSFLKANSEDVLPVTESETLHKMVGQMKGIQGHYNSCYLDSTLFSLFSFSSALDYILHAPEVYDERVQQILRQDIVNPLRKHGFVGAESVMKLRRSLRCESFMTEEKDPEEFISTLLQDVLSVEPLLKIRSDNKTQECNSYQILVDKDEAIKVPTVQSLLHRSFLSYDLKFDEIPFCLMLQMPRFGNKYKMFPTIFPSLELDITDLLYNTPRECFICSGLAQTECAQCLMDPLLKPGHSKQFCQLCERQVHSHRQRREHRPKDIDYPEGPPNSFVTRHVLQLFAVLCIKTSHFVSFVKYGPGRNSWVFFDSMAGRLGDAMGTNVPMTQVCPQLGDYLAMSEEQFAAVDVNQMDKLSRRFFCDIYMCIYQYPENGLQ
ncbi:hypothetical protein NDU88_002840 [Pleurodeles waltl]|uniref:USP domain-containing protein n=2 Tax=Pleurodeles waltl TaxID=8319 RepID=A0AAV7P9G1_PLEWA|nr:hypothetical protein NDU88_002840 [Pleurodeles waltl]